jgi:tetratricopeptide (TPR) repeat protein
MLIRPLLALVLSAPVQHAIAEPADQGTCKSGVTYRKSAAALYARGDLASAISKLRESIQFCPEEPFLSFMLGNALYRAGLFDESAEAYQAFLVTRTNHFEAHMSLGFTLFELGDKGKALHQWIIAADIEPESPFARAALAVGLYSSGDLEGAAIQYHRAVILDPRYAQSEALAIDIRWKPPVRAVLNEVKELDSAKGER